MVRIVVAGVVVVVVGLVVGVEVGVVLGVVVGVVVVAGNGSQITGELVEITASQG